MAEPAHKTVPAHGLVAGEGLRACRREGWVRFDSDEQANAISRAAAMERTDFAVLADGVGDGDGKDGVPGRHHSLPLG